MTSAIVPPATRGGGFEVIHPPSEKELFIEKLKNSTNIAIATLYMNYQDQNTKSTQTELRVLKGWGKPSGELIKLYQTVSSCGEPEKLKEGSWYVVIFNPYREPSLMSYSSLKEYIDKLGPNTYAYTSIGLVPK